MDKIKNIVIPGACGKLITLDIFFENDGEQKPVVVYAHGFNGFKDWGNFDLVAKAFVNRGFSMVKFNFSHNGTTPENPEEFTDLEAFGNNNYTKQLEDLQHVINWICASENLYRHALDITNISLIGHSMGAGIATLFAADDNRIKKLVTWAGVSECKTPWGNWSQDRMEAWKDLGVQYYTNTRTNQQMPLYYQLYEDFKNNSSRLDIEKAIKKLDILILICHGSLDIAVPVEKAYELKEWQPSAELYIVESNHVFDRKHPWIMNFLPAAMEAVVSKTIDFLTASHF
jgi:dienelactone hydrolase